MSLDFVSLLCVLHLWLHGVGGGRYQSSANVPNPPAKEVVLQYMSRVHSHEHICLHARSCNTHTLTALQHPVQFPSVLV